MGDISEVVTEVTVLKYPVGRSLLRLCSIVNNLLT